MEIILLDTVRNLGKTGDLVKVKNGFARNFLIPGGKAITANEKNKAEFEQRRAELEKNHAETLAEAQARANALIGKKIEIKRKVVEEEKLFGSVSIADIVDAVMAHDNKIGKADIHLPGGPIKTLGEHTVVLTLHPEVDVKIIVSVVKEA